MARGAHLPARRGESLNYRNNFQCQCANFPLAIVLILAFL